jgi:hypothetical protein
MKLNFSFNIIKSSLFISDRKFWFKENCPHLAKYKQGCQRVLSCPPYFITCMLIMHLSSTYLPCPLQMTPVYVTDHKECYFMRNLHRSLTSLELWCERWNVKTTEDKTHVIYLSCGNGLARCQCSLKGRNIPFVNKVKYISIIFDRGIAG